MPTVNRKSCMKERFLKNDPWKNKSVVSLHKSCTLIKCMEGNLFFG